MSTQIGIYSSHLQVFSSLTLIDSIPTAMSHTEQEPIILLYDIPRPKLPQQEKAWNLNTWKARYTLNIKGIPYKTVWVEHPDIAETAKKIGAAPTTKTPAGEPMYTLPMIYDLKTKTAVSESLAIARYLDATYPSYGPRIVPEHAAGVQGALANTFFFSFVKSILPNLFPSIATQLGPRGEEYYRRTHPPWFGGKTLEDDCLPGPVTEARWDQLQTVLGDTAKWIDVEAGPFFMGETISFIDLQIAAVLTFLKRTGDAEHWAKVTEWHDKRWARFMDEFTKWQHVDVGVPLSEITVP